MANAITIQDTGSSSTTGQGGQVIVTGTPTPLSFVDFPVTGSGGLAFQVAGTWTGTIQALGTVDGGVTWVPTDFETVGVNAVQTTITGNGLFKLNAAGFGKVRLRGSAAITGEADITAIGTVVDDLQHVYVDGSGVSLSPQNASASASLITVAAAAAGTFHSADQTNSNGRGVQVLFDATVTTTTSAVLTIEGKDPVSGKYYTLLTGAAVTSVTSNLYTLYPGVTVASNAAVSNALPKTWRVTLVVTGGSSALTATIGANVIV